MSRQHSPTDDLRELRAIMETEGLTASERIVLVAIILHRNGKSGRCDPSLARLSRHTGLAERSVRRVVRQLEMEGHLLSNRREGRSTCYSVSVPTPDTESPRTQSPPGHDVPPPRTQRPGTPDTMSPERTKERTKERTMGDDASPDGDDGRDFPSLSKLPRDGGRRIYPPEFEGAFQAMPPRHRSHPKGAAYKAWRGRVHEVEELFQLEAAADAYREDCERQGRDGTEFVMQAARFFGPGGEWEPYSGVEPAHSNGRPKQGPDALIMSPGELAEWDKRQGAA